MKKYTNVPFVFLLTMLFAVEAVTLVKISGGGDYAAHAELARYLFTHDISFDEVHYKAICAYPVYHVLLKCIHLIFKLDYDICAAMLMLACNLASALLIRFIIKEILDIKEDNYLVDYISLFYAFFMCARGPWTYWHYYIYNYNIVVGGANPIHNPTFIMVRPFMLCVLHFFCCIYKKYDKDEVVDISYLFLGGGFAVLAALSKPSFAVIYYPIMAIYTLVLMLKHKDIMFGVKILLAVLPSVIVLFLQRVWIQNNSLRLDVNVRFGSYAYLSLLQVIMFTMAALPTVFIMFDFRRLKEDVYYVVAFGGLLSGWLQLYFLDEGPDGNFAWGYFLSVTFMTVVGLANKRLLDSNKKSIRVIVSLFIYGYQSLVGLLYLYLVYKGREIGI